MKRAIVASVGGVAGLLIAAALSSGGGSGLRDADSPSAGPADVSHYVAEDACEDIPNRPQPAGWVFGRMVGAPTPTPGPPGYLPPH